jgi:hypothetical protein
MAHYGIGALTAVTILAELGDARRFSCSRHAVGYAGLAAGLNRLKVRAQSSITPMRRGRTAYPSAITPSTITSPTGCTAGSRTEIRSSGAFSAAATDEEHGEPARHDEDRQGQWQEPTQTATVPTAVETNACR